MSAASYKTLTHDLNQALATFRSEQPETMTGFSATAKAALAPGALSAEHKELMALAIGIATHCEGCIGFHVKTLVRMGVPREQFMEMLAVAVYMGGGPSLMYAAEAVRAHEQFSEPG
ncbi:carboxymuconolactone decarboxylase family protein [Oleiagrimonas sp.]|jgi:AhpD family alkylhydroperoxidase|uniref:carboxymuconolactone decarboxylase family protein n=1 Tax=Oleiagrimonas sp. TaxID=2010330 RepID=UPI0026180BAB|nr:carboxymuconolactone decarboxylase family protein [Oleiagrimonas sp.]MDA3913633.1 carboxymuconolactone decarboxylase family protein [Oleiagrimonas sp.]